MFISKSAGFSPSISSSGGCKGKVKYTFHLQRPDVTHGSLAVKTVAIDAVTESRTSSRLLLETLCLLLLLPLHAECAPVSESAQVIFGTPTAARMSTGWSALVGDPVPRHVPHWNLSCSLRTADRTS